MYGILIELPKTTVDVHYFTFLESFIENREQIFVAPATKPTNIGVHISVRVRRKAINIKLDIILYTYIVLYLFNVIFF